jgi:hypothetical protein
VKTLAPVGELLPLGVNFNPWGWTLTLGGECSWWSLTTYVYP